jgi:hypothetical protein
MDGSSSESMSTRSAGNLVMSWQSRRNAQEMSAASHSPCSSARSACGSSGSSCPARHSTMRCRYEMKRARSSLLRGSCNGTSSATGTASRNSSPDHTRTSVRHRFGVAHALVSHTHECQRRAAGVGRRSAQAGTTPRAVHHCLQERAPTAGRRRVMRSSEKPFERREMASRAWLMRIASAGM